MRDPEHLRKTIKAGKRLVIFLHDNPDPDSIASGWILQRVSEHLGVRAKIVYGGQLGRAENRTMVKLLRIPLTPFEPGKLQLRKSDRFALVDTQPSTGNNSFPHDRWTPHIVIDHHPVKKGAQADYVDIRPEHGCCATMLLEYFRALKLNPGPDLATAVAYAIISETQDLEREATKADCEAYQELFPMVRLTILGRIRHPPRERSYYRTIARAMRRALVGKHTGIVHIGPVPYPDVVAEVADFFIAMERITWCLVSGLHQNLIVLSLRTTHANGQADQVIKQVVEPEGKGGGHSVMAGGAIPCPPGERYSVKTRQISERFLSTLSRRVTERLRPLLVDKREESGAVEEDPEAEIVSPAKPGAERSD